MSAPIYWNFSRISQDKSVPRSAVGPLGTAELVGIDGREMGHLRPFPGFTEHYTLSGKPLTAYDDEAVLDQDGSPLAAKPTTGNIRLNDVFSFTMNVDSDVKAWGFVYRWWGAEGYSRTFIDYRKSGDGSWSTADITGWIADIKDGKPRQMDLQEFGSFLYIGIAGSRLIRLYFDDTSALVASSDTGPGPQPLISIGLYAGVQATEDIINAGGTAGALVQPAIPSGDEPANGVINFFGFTGTSDATFKYADLDGAIGDEDTGTYADADPTGTPINGWDDMKSRRTDDPSNLDLFNGLTPPQAFPSFIDRVTKYPNGAVLTNTPNGLWDVADRELDDPVGVVRGNYSFAYQLYDSRTGLKSQVSEIISAQPNIDLAYAASIGGTRRSPVYRTATRSDGSTDASGYFGSSFTDVTFPAIDIVYDSTKYDTLYIYRSIVDQGGAFLNSQFRLLSLDNAIDLSDYHVTDSLQPTESGWKRAFYCFRLPDAELGTQDPLIPEFDYQNEAPKPGSLGYYEGTLFFGNTSDVDVEYGGQAVWRHSTPYSVSPELVSVFARFLLSLPFEEVLDWHVLGSNIIALTRYQVYLIRKEGVSVRPYPQHAGYGVTGHRASEVVSSELYYVTNQGVKKLTASGDLYDIDAVDRLIYDEWQDDLANMKMAFDPVLKVIFLYSPANEKAICFWLNKAIISELHYIDFDEVRRGNLPTDADSATPEFEERAFFVKTGSTGVPGSPEGIVYIVDKTNHNGRYVDVGGSPSIMTDAASWASANTTSITVDKADLFGVSTDTNRLEGWHVVFKDGPLAGSAHKVLTISTFGDTASIGVAAFDGSSLDASTQYSIDIAPLYISWTGACVGLREEGPEYAPQIPDYFEPKHFTGISLAFTDVEVLEETDVDESTYRYRSGVYLNNSDTPVGQLMSEGFDGEPRRSIKDGSSDIVTPMGSSHESDGISGTIMAPSFDIWTSGLDFRIIGARLEGKKLGGRRSRNTPLGG
jgi:hypothetical protein